MSHVFLNGVGEEINSSEEVAVRLSLRDGVKSHSHQGGNACSSLEQLEWTAVVSNNRAELLKGTVTALDFLIIYIFQVTLNSPSPAFASDHYFLVCFMQTCLRLQAVNAHICMWFCVLLVCTSGYVNVSVHLCKHTASTHLSFHIYLAPRLFFSVWVTGSCNRIKSEESTPRRQNSLWVLVLIVCITFLYPGFSVNDFDYTKQMAVMVEPDSNVGFCFAFLPKCAGGNGHRHFCLWSFWSTFGSWCSSSSFSQLL